MAEGRIIAVYGAVGHGEELADQFRKAFPDGDVRLFVPGAAPDGAESIPEGVKNEAAQRNWINQRIYGSGFRGFLHVVHDSVELLPGVSGFVPELEKMMGLLDYDVWLNTVCDVCNYVYNKYVPLVSVKTEGEPQAKKIGLPPMISVTSHSNPLWTAYNLEKVPEDLLKFDDRFTIAMYWIIEFLARRKASGAPGHIYRMNQYVTVGSEKNAFRRARSGPPEDIQGERAKEEYEMFKQTGVDHRPDMDFDQFMQAFWEKIKAKAAV